MRRLLAARGTSAASVGVLVVLVAGGGYALASGGSGKITVCVSHHGGTLYRAHKCAKRDKKISWNQVGPQGPKGNTGGPGPQGPGATSLVYNATGSTSPTPAAIGNMGPYALTGTCTQTGVSTEFEVDFSGPALVIDGYVNYTPGSPAAFSQASSVPVSNATLGQAGSTATQAVSSGMVFALPSGSPPFQAMFTVAAFGGTPPSGQTANSCHFSMTITPVAAPIGSSTAALRHTPATKFSGLLPGK